MKCFYTLLLVLIQCFLISSKAQQFSATIKDFKTNTAISDVNVIYDGRLMATTDHKGRFVLSLDKDQVSIRLLLKTFAYTQREVTLHAGIDTIIYLSPLAYDLSELTVMAYRGKRGNNSFTYKPIDAKKVISLVGETDVMRYMQILPGVSQGLEGSLGFFVRGANNGNNRVELDGVPVIGPTHLMGLFSTFHPDIVEKSTFQMGGIAASSGDLLSSLLQIESLTPCKREYHGSISVSPFMLGGSIEGYLPKNKVSYQIAARTSLLRMEYQLLRKPLELSGDFDPQIQDLYTKMHWQITTKHALEAMVYGSRDYFSYAPEMENGDEEVGFNFGWGNKLGRLAWVWKIDKHLSTQASVHYVGFDTQQNYQSSRDVDATSKKKYRMSLGTEKREISLQYQLSYSKGRWSSNAGVDYSKQEFRPITHRVTYSKVARDKEAEKIQKYSADALSLFAESQYVREDKYKLRGGLRYNFFKHGGWASHGVEARLYSSVFFTPNVGIEGTYDHLIQNHHTLEGLPIGWALNLLVPVTRQFKPETSDQIYLGGFAGDMGFYLTIGMYYKRLRNLVSYKSLLNHFLPQNASWEEDVTQGRGTSYGLEVWLERRNSRLTGSLAYTLSKTIRQFSEINKGEVFPFQFDRRHNLNVQLQYITARKAKHEQSFIFALYATSGNKITVPLSIYKSEELPFWDTHMTGTYVPPKEAYHATVRTEMSGMNSYTLPYYFRVDVGYNFLFKGETVNNELSLNIFNVLNRKNPFLIFNESSGWKQVSLLPIVPSVSWRLSF
ncbi:TonB-dependent siderophore receptor [Porphyromonas sp.]|uniref:TonB-dependent receptor plug domain-containing protein n=1 Tax=Porphyromonas sp. TaxID=1924944 RepID=UPI0026DB02B2|nr:TonB-dependent receptor [Porphyromonas sp.]MDO4771166.1 TonB-dependent receptor [Porphyromonas sp.]